ASFTATVTDSANGTASKGFTLFVATAALSIATTSPLPDGTLGVPYTTSLQATGGTGAGYTFSVASGQLPTGLLLGTTGTITGTPTVAGTQTFLAQLADNGGGLITKPLSITIAPPNLTITTTSLPQAAIGRPYSATLQASGGTQPYTWSLSSGLLPTG